MPIVSAVLYTREDKRTDLMKDLRADTRIDVGTIWADRVPVVVDTPDRTQDKAVWRRLEHHPDVLRVELVFADFSDVHQEVS
ncbi:MAG: hypothetical protein KC912_19350 [Proteobacteria bacterium]|nr:hypothetical protein [Pseudomonadota bacterium]